jgi:anti-sigma regulatory factor (Ser/Thr protein kinase)
MESFNQTIRREYSQADEFRVRLNQWMEREGISEDLRDRAELAVYEVIINRIDHEQDSLDSPIMCKAGIDGEEMVITVSGEGSNFDPNHAPEVDPEEHMKKGADRGLGIYMMRKLTDSLTQRFQDGNNIIELRFNLNDSEESL